MHNLNAKQADRSAVCCWREPVRRCASSRPALPIGGAACARPWLRVGTAHLPVCSLGGNEGGDGARGTRRRRSFGGRRQRRLAMTPGARAATRVCGGVRPA